MHENMPREIKVGPYIYKVEFCNVVLNAKGELSYGEVSYVDHVIKLDQNMTEDRARVTLFHELFHAVFEYCALGDDRKEEDIILVASPIWVQVLMDNPQLREYYGAA